MKSVFYEKSPFVYIDDILDSIQAIKSYTKGISKEKFLKSGEKQDAVYGRIELIGGAARRLPDDFTQKNQDISWSEIIAMRNRLIHEYDNVDVNLVWQVIQKYIPELENKLKNYYKNYI